jgi:hypothetical protein
MDMEQLLKRIPPGWQCMCFHAPNIVLDERLPTTDVVFCVIIPAQFDDPSEVAQCFLGIDFSKEGAVHQAITKLENGEFTTPPPYKEGKWPSVVQ